MRNSPRRRRRGNGRLVLAAVLMAMGVSAAIRGCASHAAAQKIPVADPLGQPATRARANLGWRLFFDPRLSADGTVSCATCHDPDRGYSDGLITAAGIGGQLGTLNSPTVLNSAYFPHQFWDGRTIGQPAQALLPLVNPIEMGNVSQEQVVARLRGIPGYVAAFERAYGRVGNQTAVTQARLAHALASFETRIVSTLDTPLHRRLAGEVMALTAEQEMGLGLVERARCFECHVPPLFTDRLFHNNGFEFATTASPETIGRAQVDGTSFRAFKTPSWLEANRTFPYGHNGRLINLERVVRHYGSGGDRGDGRRDPAQDSRIRPQNWTLSQERAVVALLRYATASPKYPAVPRPQLPQ
jgi:cytochrome c peroxidase